MNPAKASQCMNCRKAIAEGMNTVKVVEGVLGTTGVIEIADPILFCNGDCLEAYYAKSRQRLPKSPKRIP